MVQTDRVVYVPEDSNTLQSTYGKESEPLHSDIMETSWKPS